MGAPTLLRRLSSDRRCPHDRDVRAAVWAGVSAEEAGGGVGVSATEVISITTDCFAAADGSVLCWRGVNYVRQSEQLEMVEQFADVIKRIAELEKQLGIAESTLPAIRHLRTVPEADA